MPKPLRILFAGTPEFAAQHLKALIDSDCNIVAVYTQPDRPAGRGKQLTPSPVKVIAQEADIPVEQPANFKNPADIERLAHYQADVMIVVAYGLLLPKAVLDTPKHGCINVHASLLPRWRGAAPIHRAIEAGDSETGVTIMQMDEGLDTGAMLNISKVSIEPRETTASLHDKLIELGCPALLQTLKTLAGGEVTATPQPLEGITYAHKIQKSEAMMDWHQPAAVLERRVRAFTPFPIAFTEMGDTRIKIWESELMPMPLEATRLTLPGTVLQVSKAGILVACKEGALNITKVQLPGKKAMSVEAFLNANATLIQPQYLFASAGL